MPSPRTPEQLTLARKARITAEMTALVLNERLAQEDMGYTAEHDDAHTQEEWANLIRLYAERINAPGEHGSGLGYPYRLIETASVALAALEAYGRLHPEMVEVLTASKAVVG